MEGEKGERVKLSPNLAGMFRATSLTVQVTWDVGSPWRVFLLKELRKLCGGAGHARHTRCHGQ